MTLVELVEILHHIHDKEGNVPIYKRDSCSYLSDLKKEDIRIEKLGYDKKCNVLIIKQ